MAIAAFGLPGSIHEDNAHRAIASALEVVEILGGLVSQACKNESRGQKEQQPCLVGVTSGQLFCACVGSDVRAEYTVFGDAVNLAARLMVRWFSSLLRGSILPFLW